MKRAKNRIEIMGMVEAIRETELDVRVDGLSIDGDVESVRFVATSIHRMPPNIKAGCAVWVLGRMMNENKIYSFRVLKIDDGDEIKPELFYPEKFSDEVIKRVVGEVCNMFVNNVLHDNGLESFVGWCEDGDMFEKEEHVDVMQEIAPLVDELTYKIEEIWNHTEE